jgi:ABC-type transport system involved in multi-copper enzyme maturation permease subunit
MYRTFVILRHTFRESVVQPIYSLLIAIGAAILIIFGMLPFFTLGEDTIMFKAVGLNVILLLVLISTLFATSKSIYEEIEDRTMLTLMSKPVHRWEVLVGKFLGIILAALVAIVILGTILILATCWRIPGDYLLRTSRIDENELRQLYEMQLMHVMGLVPSLVLIWLQIAVLAAVGVAISTRVSLVVNLPVVILLYIAGNLTRFLFPLDQNSSALTRVMAWTMGTILPYLQTFDISQRAVYGTIAIPGTVYMQEPSAVAIGQIWMYVIVAAVYAVAYSLFALSAGMWLFQTRELGGAEG